MTDDTKFLMESIGAMTDGVVELNLYKNGEFMASATRDGNMQTFLKTGDLFKVWHGKGRNPVAALRDLRQQIEKYDHAQSSRPTQKR